MEESAGERYHRTVLARNYTTNLSLPKNYCGIMLLVVTYKIIAIIYLIIRVFFQYRKD